MFLVHMTSKSFLGPCDPFTLETTELGTAKSKPWRGLFLKFVYSAFKATSLLRIHRESLIETVNANTHLPPSVVYELLPEISCNANSFYSLSTAFANV
jgi:hypothetical protein